MEDSRGQLTAKISQSIIAAALADLTIMPRDEVAKKHGMTRRSLNRYQANLDPTSPLAAEIQNIINNRDETWSADLPIALEESVAMFRMHVNNPDCDPKMIEALTRAIKTFNGIEMTRKVFKARGIA